MQSGPATIRPIEELGPLLQRMRNAKVKTVIVTTADGRLGGMVHRKDAERVLGRHE